MSVLQERVLVLNRLWQAVNVCTARRALALLYTGHAQVVHEDENGFNTFSLPEWEDLSQDHSGDDVVKTITFHIRLPRVILLHFFDRFPRKEIKLTRNNVFERDKNLCQYCGSAYDRKRLNIDHVIPRQHGGTTTWENVVTSCVDCNHRKANRTPDQARMRLLSPPRKPKWRPFIEVKFTRTRHHSWRHFVDLSHWKVQVGEE